MFSLHRHPIALGVTYVPVVPLIASPVAVLLLTISGQDYTHMSEALTRAYWLAAATAVPLTALVVAIVIWRNAARRARAASVRQVAAAEELKRLESEIETATAPAPLRPKS